MTSPAFITLTGADDAGLIPGMCMLTQRFEGKIEWGILLSKEHCGTPRFPSVDVIDVFRRAGLRLAAHICGSLAEQIFAGEQAAIDLSAFSRIQINKSGCYATSDETGHAICFGREHGLRTILQSGDIYLDDARVDWLLDSSFGRGAPIETIPSMQETLAFCGFSGGLSAENIGRILAEAKPQTAGRPFWIDAETALRDEEQFSLERCACFTAMVFS